METMHFRIAHTNLFRTISSRFQGVPMEIGTHKNYRGMQGNLNWMPGYSSLPPVCGDIVFCVIGFAIKFCVFVRVLLGNHLADCFFTFELIVFLLSYVYLCLCSKVSLFRRHGPVYNLRLWHFLVMQYSLV